MILYKYILGEAIQAKQAKLNALSNRVDDASYSMVRPKPIPAKPAPMVESSAEPKTDTVDAKAKSKSGGTEKAYVPTGMPGDRLVSQSEGTGKNGCAIV